MWEEISSTLLRVDQSVVGRWYGSAETRKGFFYLVNYYIYILYWSGNALGYGMVFLAYAVVELCYYSMAVCKLDEEALLSSLWGKCAVVVV